MLERILTCCLAGLLLMVGPMAGEVSAGEAGGEFSSILQMAKVGLGPMPGASVMDPVDVEEIDQAVTDHAWPMPRQRSWPLNVADLPIVETRRRDALYHTVRSYDTLHQLRRDYRRTTAELRQLNPEVDLTELEEGDEIRVWERDETEVPESRGDPQAGRLIGGEPIPDSDDYIVLFPHRAFGTYYTVSETVRVLDEYYRQFPEADPLIVGDISYRTGRRISPHSSHQSGRDVDITLPRHEPPPNYDRFHHVRRDNLDADKALWLLTDFIEGGYVEHIFLDWHHQRTLYRLAEDQGAPEEWLDEVFQYPSRKRQGIIRHEPGHATHFHVRFACQETDRHCY